MGLFPIFMNVVQFWLIDSIVKAGGTAGSTLASDQVDPADQEPLFRSSADLGDNDDDDCGADGGVLVAPTKSDIEAQGQVVQLRRSTESSHTYPPSLSGSPTAAPPASLSSPHTSPGVLSSRRNRPPPPPLLARSPTVPALNLPDTPPTSGGMNGYPVER